MRKLRSTSKTAWTIKDEEENRKECENLYTQEQNLTFHPPRRWGPLARALHHEDKARGNDAIASDMPHHEREIVLAICGGGRFGGPRVIVPKRVGREGSGGEEES